MSDPVVDESEQQLRIVADPEDVQFIQDLAAEHGVEAQQLPHEGFEPVTTITLMLFGAARRQHPSPT